jgi:hypothetical protein
MNTKAQANVPNKLIKKCVYCGKLILDHGGLTLHDGCYCHIFPCSGGSNICRLHVHDYEIPIEEDREIEIEEDKIQLIALPTQGGKTRETIALMTERKDRVHVVITKNTKNCRRQYSNRIDEAGLLCYCLGSDLGPDYRNESGVILRPSGDYGNLRNFSRLNDLMSEFKYEIPRCIIMCSTSARLQHDLREIVSALKDCRNFEDKKCFIYFDESQEYENILNKKGGIRDGLKNEPIVECMFHVTATAASLLEHENPRVYATRFYNDDNYRGTNNCQFHPEGLSMSDPLAKNSYDMNLKLIDPEDKFELHSSKYRIFYKSIYYTLKNHGEILSGNHYVFIPAKDYTRTHEVVAGICHVINQNCVVVISNGKTKVIRWFDEEGVQQEKRLDDKKNMEKAILDAVNKYGLGGRPLVITGLRCVLASQTFINTDANPSKRIGPFTHAIFGHNIITFRRNNKKQVDIIDGQSKAYQLFGRLTWIKWWGEEHDIPEFDQTTVFSDLKFEKVVRQSEHIVEEIVLNHQKKLLEKENYNEIREEDPLINLRRVHVMRFIIQREEKNWSEKEIETIKGKYESNETHNFETNIRTLEEAMEEINECSTRKFGRNVSKKKKSTIDGRFYMSNMGGRKTRVLPEIASTEQIKSHCRQYNIGNQMRGNLYACYRNTNDPDTLELWFAYGDRI